MRSREERRRITQDKAIYLRYGSAKMAVDVDIRDIANYLCDAGPGLCPRCPSRCAYGQRYLTEVLMKETEKCL